jgi:hypothetical protein
MARFLVNGWLYVICPVQGGMAVTLVHPELNRSDYFPLAVGAGILWFAAVAIGLHVDSGERSWKWAGMRILAYYLLPLLLLAGVGVLIRAAEAGEFGRLGKDFLPPKRNADADLPTNTPPESPLPALKRVTGILAAWLATYVQVLFLLCRATPIWVYLFALAWGLIRYEK